MMGAILREGSGGAVLREGGGRVLLEGSNGIAVSFVALGTASDRHRSSVAVLDRGLDDVDIDDRALVDVSASVRDDDVSSPPVDPFGGYRGRTSPTGGLTVRTGNR